MKENSLTDRGPVLPMGGAPLDGAGGVGDAGGSDSRRGIDKRKCQPEHTREGGQWGERMKGLTRTKNSECRWGEWVSLVSPSLHSHCCRLRL